jgi:hypothetical protein
MAGDLVRQRILIGLNAGRVIALIGDPDEQADQFWSYCLYRGVRISYQGSMHRLRVRFGRARRVCYEAVVEEKTVP